MNAAEAVRTRDTEVPAPATDGAVPTGVQVSDNLPFMRALPDGCCDLIYVDPPFDHSGIAGEAASAVGNSNHGKPSDSMAAMMAFLRPRFEQMHRLLSKRGSLYVHLDWRSVHHAKVLLDEVFGADQFLNEVIWSYRTGGRVSRTFARKHDTILLYAKHAGEHTFHRLRGGEFRTRDLMTDDVGRRYKSTRNGRVYFHADGPIISDVWDIPFLSTASHERVDYPSQKPEALLERVILASSNEGDLVADFFCGSGTTLAVARQLGRRCLGCDVNARAVEIAARRLGTA